MSKGSPFVLSSYLELVEEDLEGVMKKNSDRDIREELARNHACYVLITCDSPFADGRMNVEMSYEGDPVLAAYLLQGAQTYLEEQSLEEDLSNN